MFSLHFNQNSLYRVTSPRPNQKQVILDMAQAFTRQEAALPVRDRTPVYDAVQTLLTEALAVQLAVFTAENARKEASEAVKELDKCPDKSPGRYAIYWPSS